MSPVTCHRSPVVLPTYVPEAPDRNPMFLENRVYQGSSGRVYPLPFYNRIAEKRTERAWDAVHLENDFVRLMILPEIGGRIHCAQDKTNGYELFYRQSVIKPALVGLAGPWASGGVEFNWPQHHRPATFMCVDVEIERAADGSVTVWLGDHDPMERLKGMHGVCLHPDRAVIELKMRAYNRTPFTQTFLWWANVATHVHEAYQSFFPPDVSFVADHARRATSRFPLCTGTYYGVDYGRRVRDGVPAAEVPSRFIPPHCRPEGRIEGVPRYAPNDLSWYANIPVPTSYMCLGSKEDFSGGYDYKRRAGLVQIANHHIAPGKKQWTWGNHEFGYAWDRNLTDDDGPYVELMIGVYTDNQPDFSYLQPGESRTWSIYWYPIREIGPVQAANLDAAVSLQVARSGARVGVAVTAPSPGATITLWRGDRKLRTWRRDLAPDRPLVGEVTLPPRTPAPKLRVSVAAAGGRELIRHSPRRSPAGPVPAPATEPPAPADVGSGDELFVIGTHLEQYRHATRTPVSYWSEALRRDPGDARCNRAMGGWHLRRGEFAAAKGHLERAIARLTSRNPNPADGEAHYLLGLTLLYQQNWDDAYAALYKATWNEAWRSAAHQLLAQIDARRGRWREALDHAGRSLRLNVDNLRVRNLRVLLLRRLGEEREAGRALRENLAFDPLDWWARDLDGQPLRCDTQTRIDLALDYAASGFFDEALAVLAKAKPEPLSGTAPLVAYYQAHFLAARGDRVAAGRAARRAARVAPDYCFPVRLDDMLVLEAAVARRPDDARAWYYLGNLWYDRRRYDEAIRAWERSARLQPRFSIVWRNLGIAYFNVRGDAGKALRAYERAFAANPSDARLFYERDQLWKRRGISVRRRLREFERRERLVASRDDASIELCALYNQTGRHERALAILRRRKFQPWEGGEGQALGQFVRTHLALGRAALHRRDAPAAIAAFAAALEPTGNLGEAKHLLANQSDIYYWLGEAHAAAGDAAGAKRWWLRAAGTRGDFQGMSVREHSEMSFFAARSLQKLGKVRAARRLFEDVLSYADRLAGTRATVEYFATSLPTMLLFNDDLQRRQLITALFLRAQASLGLARAAAARRHLRDVLRLDPSHAAAADLLAELKTLPQ